MGFTMLPLRGCKALNLSCLAPLRYPAHMSTLAEIKRRSEGLRANCGRPGLLCGHGERLDLDMLIKRYGADYDIINETRIAAACKCERCGYRGAVIHLIANSTPIAYRK